ncbi:MAG TPA: hypothetical protein PLL26_04410 [Candidatus Dojkabacteria bacterium]|nr:hypothetical protein [Candidatus Dojkabacteria bacterium]
MKQLINKEYKILFFDIDGTIVKCPNSNLIKFAKSRIIDFWGYRRSPSIKHVFDNKLFESFLLKEIIPYHFNLDIFNKLIFKIGSILEENSINRYLAPHIFWSLFLSLPLKNGFTEYREGKNNIFVGTESLISNLYETNTKFIPIIISRNFYSYIENLQFAKTVKKYGGKIFAPKLIKYIDFVRLELSELEELFLRDNNIDKFSLIDMNRKIMGVSPERCLYIGDEPHEGHFSQALIHQKINVINVSGTPNYLSGGNLYGQLTSFLTND